MSLAERVSSMEEFDRWRDLSPTGSQRRKLSFNPVGTWVPPAANEEPVGAFEVGKVRRAFQVFAAVIYCLLAAGIVFGYAAIKPVLISEGVYADKCTEKEIEKGVRVCYEQEIRLNFMFTVAAVSTNVCALPVGTILDRYGPRVSGIIGSVFLAIGAILFAFAWDMKPFDGYIPGYFFLALGGPFVFISSFQLSNAFPRQSGLILALLTGAFDTSSAIFLFYRLIYQATDGKFWPKKFFLVYLVVPVFILIVQVLLMPALSYKTVGELVTQAKDTSHDEHDSDDDIPDEEVEIVREERRVHRESVISEITSLLGSKDANKQTQQEEEKKRHSGVWGALHGKSAPQQIASWWFVLITLFTVVQMTRINYFVATVRPQYEYMLGDAGKAADVNTFFDIALPLGGVVSVPFIGLILDNTSTTFVLSLLVSIATAIGVLGCIPHMWAAYANICLFVVYRPLYYTTVSDYSAKVFGFATFGKVYGLIICLAGLFNFSQSALDALTHKAFDNDPLPVNLMLLFLALVIGIVLVVFVWRKSKTLGKEMLREEARDAMEGERLMPGGEVGPEGEGQGQGQGQNGFSRVDYGTNGTASGS
ncbi:MFS general substrate transporter [Aulographum hederae CBS 113979]|uniref:MFS general substrate transporter n=1 Tax=Aulographum hederae CBS 113979 TaxID=1176131 RepID=A0A6G1HAY7_9PEZI|nr:MFS general substrate transporter [Aulographum hederae CBS 113979]